MIMYQRAIVLLGAIGDGGEWHVRSSVPFTPVPNGTNGRISRLVCAGAKERAPCLRQDAPLVTPVG